jgi:predicted Na+-dependent transporter
MKRINRFFSLFLLLSCVAGMFIPPLGSITGTLIIISLAVVIFSSFFQINLSLKSLRKDSRLSFIFIAARFIILPSVVFLILSYFSELWATIMLLMLLLPAAVSSPAFSALFGGKPELSLKILLYSSFISIAAIPYLLKIFIGDSSGLNIAGLLVTLMWTIFLPFAIHLPLRKVKPVREFMLNKNSLVTLISLSIMGAIVTAQNKETITGKPLLIGGYAVISMVMYLLMYFAGYYFMRGSDTYMRRTLSISSGANNIGLGVTITALYFTGSINIFFIVSQIVWTLILIPVRPWLLKREVPRESGRTRT